MVHKKAFRILPNGFTMPPMMMFDNAAFRYGQDSADAVRDVTFALPEGSFTFLSGASGSGKTTIFRMLYMDLLPTRGTLMLFGRNVNHLSRDEIAHLRRQMGIVFQDFRLLGHLTVRENVLLPLTLHGYPTAEQERAVDEILDWVGLAHKRNDVATRLSGGEMQRVAIARAVVGRPKVLIADEPTGNVDAVMAKRIMHLFCELHKHGTTILLATHDREMVQSFGFPCVYLAEGTLHTVTRKKSAQAEDTAA
ncbi:MAG: ATP-binding cassette domain-containing protein [Alphaproteobacteria bacterium]